MFCEGRSRGNFPLLTLPPPTSLAIGASLLNPDHFLQARLPSPHLHSNLDLLLPLRWSKPPLLPTNSSTTRSSPLQPLATSLSNLRPPPSPSLTTSDLYLPLQASPPPPSASPQLPLQLRRLTSSLAVSTSLLNPDLYLSSSLRRCLLPLLTPFPSTSAFNPILLSVPPAPSTPTSLAAETPLQLPTSLSSWPSATTTPLPSDHLPLQPQPPSPPARPPIATSPPTAHPLLYPSTSLPPLPANQFHLPSANSSSRGQPPPSASSPISVSSLTPSLL